MKTFLALCKFLLGSAFFAAVSTASAQSTYYWDSNGTTSGFGNADGTWGTSTFWSTSSAGTATTANTAITTSDTVHFGTAANPYGTATRTVTVSTTRNVGTVIFGNTNGVQVILSGGTVNFGANGVITLNNTGATTWNSTITGADTSLTINGGAGTGFGNAMIYNGAFSGGRTINIAENTRFDQAASQSTGANLTYNIEGLLALRNNGTTIQIGELTGSGSIGTGGNFPADSVVRVIVGGKNTSSTFSGTISASIMGLTKEGSNTLTLTGNNTYGNTTLISAGTLQIGNGGTTGALSGTTVITNNSALIFNRSDNLTVSNDIGGTGTLTKQGAGAMTLSGTSTYNGATFVSAGTLLVTGALGNTAVTVGANGTIGGTGSLGGSLAFDAGANLDLTGAMLGITSTGILTVAAGQTMTFTDFKFTDIVGWDWMNADAGTYTLIDGGGTVTLSGDTPTISNMFDFGNGKQGYFQQGSFQAVIIPEPTTALLGGLGLLLLLRRRRIE